MANTLTDVSPQIGERSLTHELPGIPWYLWCAAAAVTSATIGGDWDISWHRTIGRDTFWTPAHLAIQFCGVLGAIVCAYLILRSTFFDKDEAKLSTVRVLGFRGPLGAFLTAWGGITMLTSAPFDNWWHNAYGLDVKIISLPHSILFLGFRGVGVGVLLLLMARINRSRKASSDTSITSLLMLFLYLGALLLCSQMSMIQSYVREVALHRTDAYLVIGIWVPVILAMLSIASRFRWAATTIAAVYLLYVIAQILVLPLFPAEPKLGPVFVPVTHMIPQRFPILLIAPAFALDLLWRYTTNRKRWQIALLSGIVFTVVLVSVEWPFASFLMTKASETRFFGTAYFSYDTPPNSLIRLRRFAGVDHGLALFNGLLIATFSAAASTWIGMQIGGWMRRVQR